MGRPRAVDDNWFGVENPRKRKQIQDRLAQRARRQRLAEAKRAAFQGPSALDKTGEEGSGSPKSPCDSNSSSADSSRYLLATVPRTPDSFQAYVQVSTQPDKCVPGSLTGSVYAALFNNGAVLGITCSAAICSKSKPSSSRIPATLAPTSLQLSTVHPQWIDRFPFPRMRDNMITLMSIIDEEEFLADLFCLTSFSVRPGAAPWDPKAWKIGQDFSAKWGYLFF